MNKLVFSLGLVFVMLLSLNLVSAEVNVTYKAFYAEINEDGSITYTETPVNDFDTLGYVCTSSSCLDVSDKIDGLTKDSSGNSVTLTYPTTLQNSNGYGVWFYKEGYGHWEANPNWAGEGVVSGFENVYLLRKAEGWAPINTLSVVNEVNPSIPVEVGVNVGIDANTYSALQNAGPLEYNPSELDSINVVETQVHLRIWDSSNSIVHQEIKNVEIPYSEYVNVSFTYPGFGNTGEYEVEITAEVTDSKILSVMDQVAESMIRVIPQGLADYSYTLINNLSMDEVFPEVNQTVKFSFDHVSYFIDEFGVQSPLDTNANIIFYREGVEIENIPSYVMSFGSDFEFSKIFNESGSYKLVVNGTPVNPQGSNGTFSSAQEITFIVQERQPTDTTAPVITITSPTEGATYNVSDVLVKVKTDEAAIVWFNLNGGSNTTINSSDSLNFEYNLTGLSDGSKTLVIYAKDSVGNSISKTVSFSIDTDGDDDDDKKKKKDKDNDSDKVVILENEFSEEDFVTPNYFEDETVTLNLDVKKEHNWNLIFWMFLILLVILILVTLVLIVKRI